MKTTIAIVSLVFLQAAFFAVTFFHNPIDNFAAYYFTWVLVPSTIAALAFSPQFHFVAAISNAIVATLLFDYLFLEHGYFWPDRPKESPSLAIGYIVIGIGLAFIVAGFIHAIIERIKRSTTTGKFNRTLFAIRKGFLFSMICAAVAFPICTMFGPVGLRVPPNPTYLFATLVATCLIVFGTITSMIVGLTFNPAKTHSGDRG